tara:strand:- start:2533 stop:3501 length:969 start_codon:yes stop_codon:yes gene_type:complete
MKNNLIIILSHCDTDQKVKVLQDNIVKLKSKGLDILLVSHIPVSSTIQSQVEYVIYDKSNPIILFPYRGMVFWKNLKFNSKKLYLQNITKDYGWTAYNQILLGGNLGLSLDYDFYSFINYDIVLTEGIMGELDTPSPFLTTKVKDDREEEGHRYPSFMLNILSKDNLKKLLPVINKKYYMSDAHPWLEGGKFPDAESYFGHLISLFEYTTYPEPIVDQIAFDNVPNLFNFSKHREFKLFFQNGDTHKRIASNSWVPRVVVYDNSTTKLNLIVNEIDTEVLGGANVVLDMPEVKLIGYVFNGEFTDLTKKYKESIFSIINYKE